MFVFSFILARCIWQFWKNFFHDCMVYSTSGNHAVRSCSDFAKLTGGICWWLSGSSRRCTWFLWVGLLIFFDKVVVLGDFLEICEVTSFPFFILQIGFCYVFRCHCGRIHSYSICSMYFLPSYWVICCLHKCLVILFFIADQVQRASTRTYPCFTSM